MFKPLPYVLILAATLTSCVSIRSTGVLPLGGNEYTITAESETNKIRAKTTAITEAEQYCLAIGKEFNVLDIREGFGNGVWDSTNTYTVNFRCK